jgi:protein arginine kinase activator
MRAGCPNDYLVFGLGPLLEQYHGSDRHVGKVPSTFKQESDRQKKLKDMQTALDTAVKTENYEEAARLRDEITKLGKES